MATFALPGGREKVVDIAHRPAAVAVIPVKATGLPEVSRREEDSHIHPLWVTLEHSITMVWDGEIRGMKAMLALPLLAEKQRRDRHANTERRDA